MSALVPWHESPLMGLDLETTGVSVHEDRIVTASIVYVAGILRPRTYNYVINPGIPIPDSAAQIHGWTTEKVQTHPKVREPGDALFEIVGRIALAMNRSPELPLVAFNAAYDLTLLDAECRRHDVDPLSTRLERGLRPVVDPFVLDKAMSRRKGSRKLVDQCAFYEVLLGDAHSADADAVAACRLIPRMVAAHPKLGTYGLEALHDQQVVWRRGQMDSLRGYFDSKGTPHDGCNSGWPLQSVPVTSGATS